MPQASITSFRGQYAFLSNFFPCRPGLIFLHYALCGEDSRWYASVEHAYQASKTLDVRQRDAIRQVEIQQGERTYSRPTTAAEAKSAGGMLVLRPDWARIKLDIMYHLLQQKFRDPLLQKLLLRTQDAELVEGNVWNDTYWGVCSGVGENHLGRLLMLVRFHLKEKIL